MQSFLSMLCRFKCAIFAYYTMTKNEVIDCSWPPRTKGLQNLIIKRFYTSTPHVLCSVQLICGNWIISMAVVLCMCYCCDHVPCNFPIANLLVAISAHFNFLTAIHDPAPSPLPTSSPLKHRWEVVVDHKRSHFPFEHEPQHKPSSLGFVEAKSRT
jgi:hypothetical protein